MKPVTSRTCRLWFLGWLAAAAQASADEYVQYTGTAAARHSAEFLYGERHVLTYHEGRLSARVVLYTCQDGSAFARKTVNYVDPLAPDFLLEDAATGMREGVRGEGRRTIQFRANHTAKEKIGEVPQTRGLVIDAGFDEFIRANWDSLLRGQSVDLPFLVPSRLQVMGFQVEHLASEQSEGAAAEVFRMKLDGILGWFLPGIDVTYSTRDRVLLVYDGLSDLRDAAGDNMRVHIVFKSAARTPSNADADRAARQAPLAPCH